MERGHVLLWHLVFEDVRLVLDNPTALSLNGDSIGYGVGYGTGDGDGHGTNWNYGRGYLGMETKHGDGMGYGGGNYQGNGTSR